MIAALGKQYQIFPTTGFGTLYGTKRMVAAAPFGVPPGPMCPADIEAPVDMVKEIAPRHGLEPLITFTT